jgi:hypothetical protein
MMIFQKKTMIGQALKETRRGIHARVSDHLLQKKNTVMQ